MSLQITTLGLPKGTANVPYSQQLTASGGSPPYTWSIVDPPAGFPFTLSGSGLLQGTPAGAYISDIEVQVQDTAGYTDQMNFAVVVSPGPPAPPPPPPPTPVVSATAFPSLKSFQAKGDGQTDDTNAIKAALAAVGSGLLLVDPGTYYIGSPPVAITNPVSLLGAGVPGTIFIGPTTYTGPLFQFDLVSNWQFQHGGRWRGFGVDGRNSGCVGFDIVNSIFPQFEDYAIANCAVGIDLRITSPSYFTERVLMRSGTFSYNGAGIRFNNQSGDLGRSFAYGVYDDIHFNTAAGQCLFKLLNCGSSSVGSGVYACSFNIKGNMTGNDCVFDCSDGSNLGLYCDGVIVAETGGTGGPSVMFHGPASPLTSGLWGLWNVMISGNGVLNDGQWRVFHTQQYCAGAESAWSA